MPYIRQHHFIHTDKLVRVSALKRPSSGCTDIFRQQGQQNAFPVVNIRLKSTVGIVSIFV